MIIFCAGMRRSASTLQYHLTRRLLTGYTDLGWVTWQEFDKCYVDNAVLKCHPFIPEFSDLAAGLFRHGNAKAVYVYRDIRDVAVSMIRVAGVMGTNVSRLESDIIAVIRSYYKWTSLESVHVARYEDMIFNLPAEVMRLAEFLGAPVSVKKASRIARQFSADKQRKRQPVVRWSKKTLLHPTHVGTGEMGQWKKGLNKGQIKMINRVAGRWLTETGYL